MENTEMMEVQEMDNALESEVMVEEHSGMSTGVAVLLGAAATAATVAIVKLGKKVWANITAQKQLRHPDHEVEVTEDDIETVTK